MNIKRMLSGLVILALVFAIITGCSSKSSNEPAATNDNTSAANDANTNQESSGGNEADAEEVEPYELSVAWWGGEARHKKILEMIDEYMKRFPHAKIVSQYAAYGDYWPKLATQAASGNMPDVYLVQLTYLGEYASKGLMRPLQDLVDAGKIDVSNFTPGALSGSSYNGELVGITFGDTACCVAINKSLIESVNYPLPKDQMTYSETAEYLKGLAQVLPEGYYASSLGARHEFTIETFTRQHGLYGITTEDGKALGYTKEVLAEYLSYFYDLFKAGVNGPLEVILEDRDKQFADSLAGKGRIAYWMTNVNQVKIFQASVEDELEIIRFPVIDNPKRQNAEVAVCSTWAISGNTDKVDQAAHFINYMVNDWELQEIFDMDIGVPGSTVIQEKLMSNLDMNNKVDVMKKREIEVMQNILNTIEPFNGRPAGYGPIVEDLYNKIDEVLFERMTVEEAVEAHFNAAETLLN